jgi:hypothetical protein
MSDQETIAMLGRTIAALTEELAARPLQREEASKAAIRMRQYRNGVRTERNTVLNSVRTRAEHVTHDVHGGVGGGVVSSNGSTTTALREVPTTYDVVNYVEQQQTPVREAVTNSEHVTHGVAHDVRTRDAQRATCEAEFEVIWPIYPRRPGNNRKAALNAYLARRRVGVTADELKRATENYRKQVEREGTDEKFIKLGSTFYGPSDHWRTALEVASEAPRVFRGPTPPKPLTPAQLAEAATLAALDRAV